VRFVGVEADVSKLDDVAVNSVEDNGTVGLRDEDAIGIDDQTGAILLDKNADEHMPTASMIKIMTAYVVYTYLRDGKAGWVMGPTNEVLRQFIGKTALLGMESLDYWNQVVNERALHNEVKKMSAEEKRALAARLLSEAEQAEQAPRPAPPGATPAKETASATSA